MRLQIHIDKTLRSEIEIIKIRIDVFATEDMISGTNQTVACSLFEPSLKRTKMDNKISCINNFVV
ncbi:hypothetical protein DXA77_03525 [Bifidobacterium adolescentis]|nr:hypothetical protein DXA77_03525 [Bifidobacterium adolescentis]